MLRGRKGSRFRASQERETDNIKRNQNEKRKQNKKTKAFSNLGEARKIAEEVKWRSEKKSRLPHLRIRSPNEIKVS